MDRDVEAGMLLEADSFYGGRFEHEVRSLSFYVASSYDGLADVKALLAAVRKHNCRVAFDWTEHVDHQCSMELCGIANRQVLAHRELRAATSADWFIGCARLGKDAHVELGAAFGGAFMRGHQPRILLIGVWDGRGTSDSLFYEHASVDLDSAEELATEILRIVEQLRDKQIGKKRSTPSVLQPWLEEIPLRMQSTLLLGLRGPDTHACPNVKAIGRWLRGLAFKPGNPDNVREFMGEMPSRIVEKGPAAKELEFCSQHYHSHLMHALEVVAYCHPNRDVADHANVLFVELFVDMCSLMHLPVESPNDFGGRLGHRSWPGGGQPNDFEEAMALMKEIEGTEK